MAPAVRADWPKCLGPDGDGIVREKGLAEKWPEAGPKRLWAQKAGQGYSSPVAQDGKLYLFSTVEKKDTLAAYNADTGEKLWSTSYASAYTGQYPGTRATPTIDADRIYTYGGAGDLTCWNLADGKEIWRRNVIKDTKATGNLGWGTSSSPLIVGDLLYVQNGSGSSVAVAYNKVTGDLAWQSEAKGLSGYAHIIQIEVDGVKQLIVFAGKALYGMNPADGKTLWSHPWETSYDVNATTPIYRDGHLFITSNYGHGCLMLKPSATGAQKVWETKDVMARFQPPILDNGLLYANSEGTLKCLTWPDGKVKWQQNLKIGMGGSFLRFDDKLILMSERGKLTLAKATGEGLTPISQFQAFDDKEVWSTPLIYKGRIYCKGTDELVCLDIATR